MKNKNNLSGLQRISTISQSRNSDKPAIRKANKESEQDASMLEQRTRQLLIGAQVSRVASSILEPDELCQQVVDMLGKNYKLYFVGLYLVDDRGKWAILHAATGQAGQQLLENKHRLKVGGTSMIGWCIANQKARIALDVGKEAVRFNNPLLPNTRSELALPLISRGKMIGALGIQSDREAAFSEEDIAASQAMADQLAIAISNARLYDQLHRELAERKRGEKEIRKLNAELERRVAQRTSELQAANEHLTSLSHVKDEFITNISHELRTPITSIMLYHNLLETKPESIARTIPHLKRETQRLARLIEDLLCISRLDQGYMSFNPSPLDLNQLAERYVNDRELLASQHALSLTFEGQQPPPNVNADEQMIGQVISILMTNAINYTPAGGDITVRTLAVKQDGRTWAGLSISDTGPGISPEDQKHLFERFFRGTAGRTTATPGTGLGLAIAKEIINKHHGQLEVQSDGVPGKGTTFFIWLPVAS